MNWRLRFGNAAKRTLKGLPRHVWASVVADLATLVDDPMEQESIVQLRGHRKYWRLRSGGYRILYRVALEKKEVYIFRIEKRSGATYRSFNPEEQSLVLRD